jgi:hypothetical protein
MSTWNIPLWGEQGQPGTVDDQPPFPELYIRNYLNDEGILASELTPLQRVVDKFVVEVNQLQFTLSKVPSQFSSPIVYWNNAPQYPTANYILNSRTVTFPSGVLNVGDSVVVIYEGSI